MTRPEDFASDSPPARTIGTECEYNMQAHGKNPYHNFVSANRMQGRGVQNHNGYLGSAHGSGRTYPDVGHLEFDTKEAVGPAAAAIEDITGIGHISSIVTSEADTAYTGLFRLSGTFIPDGLAENIDGRVSSGRTSGYHENYLTPRWAVYSPLINTLMPTVLATRLWGMSGTLRQKGFVTSQKVWGVGGAPVEHSLLRRTEHGNKPMVIIPPSSSDGDTIGNNEWARVEVRMADPGLSLVGRFASFASVSLALRLIEQGQRIGPGKVGSMCLADPVAAAKEFAGDLTLTHTHKTVGGRLLSALDIQESLLDLCDQLNEDIELPLDEKIALSVLRQLIDALRKSDPSKAEYSPLAALRVEFAAKQRFINDGSDPERVKASSKKHMQRSLLWDRVLPEGNGLRFWQKIERRDPLIGKIRELASSADILPRTVRRAAMIDQDNGDQVINWSYYRDHYGNVKSLCNPIGD